MQNIDVDTPLKAGKVTIDIQGLGQKSVGNIPEGMPLRMVAVGIIAALTGKTAVVGRNSYEVISHDPSTNTYRLQLK